MVLLCFSLFCRKQVRTDEIGRKSTTLEVLTRAVSHPYASRIITCHDPMIRPSSLTILTSARGSHHPDTGRVQRLPPGPERPNWSPFRLNAEGYLKGWCQIRFYLLFPPFFTESLERGDQEKSKDWRKLGEEARREDRRIDLILFISSTSNMICSFFLSFILFCMMCE